MAAAWLDDHGRNLGHFINGQWVKPEGRQKYDTHNPATGEKLATTVQGKCINESHDGCSDEFRHVVGHKDVLFQLVQFTLFESLCV